MGVLDQLGITKSPSLGGGMQPSPVRRPEYTNRVNIKDVRDVVRSSLRSKYGNKLSNKDIKQFFQEHKELNNTMNKKLAYGVTSGQQGTVEKYRAKHFMKTLGQAVRATQQAQSKQTIAKEMKEVKGLAEKSQKELRSAVGAKSVSEAKRKLEKAEKFAEAAKEKKAEIEKAKEETQVQVTHEGKKAFTQPKTTLKKLTELRLEDMTPKDTAAEDLAAQERRKTALRRLRRFEQNRDEWWKFYRERYKGEEARSSIAEGIKASGKDEGGRAADFHKDARSSITDYGSIPTSINDDGQRREPLGSISEAKPQSVGSASERPAEEGGAGKKSEGTEGENSGEDSVDDNLPLAA
jgi:hypothetical protein